MGEWYNENTLPHSIMEVSMKRSICIVIALALVLILTGPALAASLGIGPSDVELEVPADGSALTTFKVYYFTGDLQIELVDIPLRVEPETIHVEQTGEYAEIEVTIYGDPSLGSQVYNGYIKFTGMSGETVAVAVQVKAKVTNIVEGQAVPEEPDIEENTSADQKSNTTSQGGIGDLSRNTVIIIAAAIIFIGLVILAVSFARRR